MSYRGVWVSLFYRRGHLAVIARCTARAEAENPLGDGNYFDDEAERMWVDDAGVRQWHYPAASAAAWKPAWDRARGILDVAVNEAGTENVFGMTVMLLTSGATPPQSDLAQLQGLLQNSVTVPQAGDSHRGVEIQLCKPPLWIDRVPISLLLLRSPRELSGAETSGILKGLESDLVNLELTAHKSAWLASQILRPEVESRIKAILPRILHVVAELRATLKTPDRLAAITEAAACEQATVSELLARVDTVTGELQVQRSHLRAFRVRRLLPSLTSAYARITGSAIDGAQALSHRLRLSHDSLGSAASLARASAAAHEAGVQAAIERRNQRLETALAVVGVGLGTAELFSDSAARALLDIASKAAGNPDLLAGDLWTFAARCGLVAAACAAAAMIVRRLRR